MSDATERYPHEPIVQDMVGNALGQLSGLSKKMRRLILKKSDGIVIYSTGSAVLETKDIFNDPPSDTLLALIEPTDDEVRDKISRSANLVGGTTMWAVAIYSPSETVKALRHPFLRVPDHAGKISLHEFGTDVWAPDYTDRFMEARSLAQQANLTEEAIK